MHNLWKEWPIWLEQGLFVPDHKIPLFPSAHSGVEQQKPPSNEIPKAKTKKRRSCTDCKCWWTTGNRGTKPYSGGSCDARNCKCPRLCWRKRSSNARAGTAGNASRPQEGPYRRPVNSTAVWSCAACFGG